MITDRNRKWWVLGAMGTILGVVTLDETVIGVALPTINKELGLTTVASHWVVNAYLLVFTGLAAAAGRLGDIIGLKALFLAGMAIFMLASIACGFAQDGDWLIAMRALQGVGAAVIFPGSLVMMTHAFPEEERGMAMGIYGSIGTLLLSLGPFLGGLFSEYLSWRWIFWINPPFILAVAVIVLAGWRDPPREGPSERLDFPGLLTLVAALGLMVFAIMQGPDWGWSNPTIWLIFGTGVIFLIAFVLVEARARQPLIDVVLFRNGAFTTFNLVVFTAQFSKIAIFVFVALYLQSVVGFGALIAGVMILFGTIPTVISSYPTGIILDRIGSRTLLLGGAGMAAVAMFWMCFAVVRESYLLVVPALIVWGFCISVLFIPALRDVMMAVPPEKRGEAGGISMTAQLLGGTVGMTICGALIATTSNYMLVYLVTGALFVLLFVLVWIHVAPASRSTNGETSG